MANYTVNHNCGHQENHKLSGAYSERERRISWLESQGCSDCSAAEARAFHAAKNEAAATENQAAGFPALTGSEKQVAWAESIRAEKIKDVDELLELGRKQLAAGKTDAQQIEKLESICNSIKNHAPAAWWIENRNTAAIEIIRRLHG